ncbi:MAG: hypothetical protein JWN15_1832 [Firmicutes bacterium]|nr:hypothetical protein [Bacillota bacterium]
MMERWSEIGHPVLIGATAYDLMVAPDIDIEIFRSQPTLQDAFMVLSAYAGHPRITSLSEGRGWTYYLPPSWLRAIAAPLPAVAFCLPSACRATPKRSLFQNQRNAKFTR